MIPHWTERVPWRWVRYAWYHWLRRSCTCHKYPWQTWSVIEGSEQ